MESVQSQIREPQKLIIDAQHQLDVAVRGLRAMRLALTTRLSQSFRRQDLRADLTITPAATATRATIRPAIQVKLPPTHERRGLAAHMRACTVRAPRAVTANRSWQA
jgi:hypothetical protein